LIGRTKGVVVLLPRPKIGIFNAIADMGGAEYSLLECLRYLRNSYEFRLLVPANGPLKQRAEELGAIVDILPWPDVLASTGETAKRPSLWDVAQCAVSIRRQAKQVSDWARDSRISALVTNSIKCHVIGAMRPSPAEPLIWYLRDGFENRFVSRRLLAALARRPTAAICISNYVAVQTRRYVSATLPLHVIYNIIDLENFRPSLSLPADLQKDPGEIWFGVVGAVTPLKGQDLFLRAAATVAHELPGARFLIVGTNGYLTQRTSAFEQDLAIQARQLGLEEKVRFLGWRADVPQIVANLDVLVQSNRGPEGLGRSVLEAMACAVPVIAVDRWGPAELLGVARNGLAFPYQDTEAMAERMLQLGRDREQRKVLGANGRDWIGANLLPEVLASKVRSVIVGAIATPKFVHCPTPA
jgi:glycosyltransferase involved in cell wall biosynthesis